MAIDYSQLPIPKGAKGQSYIDARERRKAIADAEEAEKQKVRLRDRRCRWPHCANCKRYQPRLECAHLDPKGMGGDPTALRTTSAGMMLLDFLTHQSGPSSLEQHGKKIEPLTAAGTDGPCSFWQADGRGGWVMVAQESAPFVYVRD